MKRLTTLIILTLVVYHGVAQQLPQYSQYNFNYFIQNPAVGGIDKPIEVQVGYRTQWAGFESEPPRTGYISIHGPINYEVDKNVHHKMKPHHGMGAFIYRDKAGLFSYTGVNLSYSYHINLTRKDKLSFGAFMGFKQLQLDGSSIVFTQSPTDPKVAGVTETQLVPDASIGIWYHSDRIFAGFSAHQLLSNSIEFSQGSIAGSFGQLDFHYMANVGGIFPVGRGVKFIPSVLMKSVSPAPFQLDVSAKTLFNDTYWVMAAMRNADALIMGVGMFYKKFKVGYAFDLALNDMRSTNYGTHEVIFEVFLNQKKVMCPSKFW